MIVAGASWNCPSGTSGELVLGGLKVREGVFGCLGACSGR